jgi:O-antigen/teichoic acid export membrane protein
MCEPLCGATVRSGPMLCGHVGSRAKHDRAQRNAVGVAELSAEQQSSTDASDSELDVLDTPAAGGLFVRGGALRLGGYAAVVALSVLSAALLTRHLGVVRFGQYTTVISLVSLVAVITDVGMSNLGTREYALREGREREELMRDLLGLRMTLTLIGVVVAIAFALAAGYGTSLLLGTLAASLATVALVLQHTLSIPLSAALRLGTLSLLDVARQAMTVIAIVALVLLGAGLLPLLAATLLVNLLLVPLTAALVRDRISLRIELHPRRWLSLLGLTVSFSLATAVGTIYVYTAQILTSLVASPKQSGLFAASFRVFIVAGAVPGLLVSGALPLLARAARDDRKRLVYALSRIFDVSLILGVAAAIALLGGAQFVISVVAGPKYAGATEVLRIQGLALIASFVVAGWSFALISIERYRSILLVNAAALIVSCALTLILASSHGATGAALATIFGEATLAVGSLIALTRGNPEFRPPLAIILKVAIAAVPAAALALAADLPSLVRALLAVALYGLVIVVTRATPKEIVELIPRRSAR